MKIRTAATDLMPWAFAALLALGAMYVLGSGRDLSQQFQSLMRSVPTERSAVMIWVQRGVSLLLIAAALGQFTRHFAQHRRLPSVTLLCAFVLYWTGTVGMPMVFAAYPVISHEYLYSLVFGIAVCMVDDTERERIVHTARNALFALMLVGLALIPVSSAMVLDTGYSQGIIAGLPRFGGLTPHPVTQGMLAQVALLVLWCHPYPRRWLNAAAWMLGLSVLFLAQSKTAWIAFAACALLLMVLRGGGAFWRRLGDPRSGGFGVLGCTVLMLAVLGLAGWVLVGDAFGQAAAFVDSSEGAQLMSLTGRDRIWVAAWQEWEQNPVFGYGLSIWDAAYRAAIGMPQATHAHNQFLDDLARAGTIGATALVLYALVLLGFSIRAVRASGGLSLALFVTIALRSISEAPLSLEGYGMELFTHLLLVALVAGASTQGQAAARAAPLRFGVAS